MMTLLLLLAGCNGDLVGKTPNQPPAVNVLVPVEDATLPGGRAPTFTAWIADEAIDAVELTWSWEGGAAVEGEAAFADPLATLTLAAALDPGAYAAEVRATDDEGKETVATFGFTVAEPALPDFDGDGHADAAAGGADCNDADDTVFPGAQEVCDGVDQDCDGAVDDGVIATWNADDDGDGWGAAEVLACALPAGASATGEDCDDTDPDAFPGAVEVCDGDDDDCDGEVDEGTGWYVDADSDGWGDPNAPRATCDPTERSVPDATDCADADPDQRWCRGCAEELARDPGAGDDTYTLAAPGGVPYDAWCDMDDDGGGWTLVATNDWAGDWDVTDIVDDSTFGTPSLATSFKGEAFTDAPFTDVRFDNGVMKAIYEGVGDGDASWYGFQQSIPPQNCGPDDGYAWPMTDGDLVDRHLCDTDLYVSPQAFKGGRCTGEPQEDGWGPTWSASNSLIWCPLEDTAGTGFVADVWGFDPWGTTTPLRMWVR